jgi:hypothetical protein
MQLITSVLFQNLTTCFGPYGPSSGDIFEDSHSTAIHPSFYSLILHPVAREIQFNHLATSPNHFSLMSRSLQV